MVNSGHRADLLGDVFVSQQHHSFCAFGRRAGRVEDGWWKEGLGKSVGPLVNRLTERDRGQACHVQQARSTSGSVPKGPSPRTLTPRLPLQQSAS